MQDAGVCSMETIVASPADLHVGKYNSASSTRKTWKERWKPSFAIEAEFAIQPMPFIDAKLPVHHRTSCFLRFEGNAEIGVIRITPAWLKAFFTKLLSCGRKNFYEFLPSSSPGHINAVIASIPILSSDVPDCLEIVQGSCVEPLVRVDRVDVRLLTEDDGGHTADVQAKYVPVACPMVREHILLLLPSEDVGVSHHRHTLER